MTSENMTPEETMTAFARTRVRDWPGLGREETFPRDLWAEMGRCGLLDPDTFSDTGIPENRCPDLTRAARALVREGGNLGLALSWIIHHLTAHYILGMDRPPKGKRAGDLVRDLRRGAATLAFAVSEPEGGGHPKFISTRAKAREAGWVISGEKTYLTNGPIARAFVVIAVTGQAPNGQDRDGQGKIIKEFSAFLVDRENPGLTSMPPMEIPFFKPSPHGGIRLEDCRVGPDALVGIPGRAYPDLVLRFRGLEDALMTGAVTGAMDFLLNAAARQLAGREDSATGESLGRLVAMADAAGVLSDQVAAAADSSEGSRKGLHLFFRDLVSIFIKEFQAFLAQASVKLWPPGQILLQDLKASAGLGKTVSRLGIRKLGLNFIRSAC